MMLCDYIVFWMRHNSRPVVETRKSVKRWKKRKRFWKGVS